MARSSKRALKDLVFALNASERPVSVTGAAGGFSAMLLALLQRELDRPIILVTATQARAAELRDGLSFFAEDGPLPAAVLLPQPDVTPWHPITPNRTGTLERLATLYRLATDSTVRFAVMPAPVLATRTIPRSELMSASAMVRVDDDLDRDQFARQLDGAGYVRVPVVEDPGTYALRGGIVDVWPGVSAQPVRIDLFGDLVESLKRFDPETQRSREKLTALWIPPARDILLNDDTILRGRSALRQQAGELGIPTQRVRAVLAELDEGIWPLGVEGWLPAFYEDLSTVADFVPDNALWCFEDPSEIRTTLDAQYEAGETLYGEATERAQLAFPPSQVYSTAVPDAQLRLLNVAWEEDLADTHHVAIKYQAHADLQKAIEERRGEDHAFEPAAERVRGWVSKGKLPIVVGASAGHAERLRGLFAHYGLKTRTWDGVFSLDRVEAIREAEIEVNIFVGRLARGFGFGDLAFLGADDVVPQRRREHHRKVKGFQEASLESFRQLDPGNLIVHIDHGIGRYEGLFKLVAGGIAGDYLKLSYRGDDVLYVPVYKLDRVQRYVGGEDAAPRLDKLGGVTWEKSHARAKKAAENIARELISLQAARQARKREAYSPIDDYFEEFAASFPWDETPDQQRAIDDIMQDMDSEQPMDRLVCGDVGYGKTEVAMRAAFRAILDRKQVAVLVPTTVLAEQHRLTFEDRFRGYPVTIAALSRFRTREQEKKIITQLTAGRVDIVIGTHRMLSKDVQFRDLGLIIVDEEHRFGVKHKEKLKMVKEMADVLTLTATPIPRTLNMSLSGLRDMSIIATPPTDRLAVRTLVSRIRDEVMVEALERELDRHGQAYVVHNRVDSIYALADRLQKLVPRGRFVVAHGQMKESELEKAMLRFMAGEADVLVCTTIIESGLDIPRANTMLIHRADRLGLAQLYQLRGRVGR
ncbi:MAG: transcription-repair coupling factor (superfamily II helicase), partial [Myxococcota bacterium]